MAPILALLEGSSAFAVAAGTLLILVHPALDGWGSLLTVLAGAGGLALSCLLAFYYAGFYDRRVIRSFEAFLGSVPRAIGAAISLMVLVSLAIPAARILKDPLESGVLLAIGTIFGPVLLLRAVAYRVMRSRRFVQRLLIVGASPLGWRLVHEVESRLDYRYAVAAIVDDASDAADTPLVIGPLDRLEEIVDGVRPDRIVLAMPDWPGRLPVRELLNARVYRGIPIQDAVEVFERLTGKLAIEALTPSHLILADGFCQSRLTRIVRRCVSVLVAIVGLVATAPLLALIALAITTDSGGPVLFTQRRLGLHGRPFVLLKFRSMRPTDMPSSEWERDNRDRVTRVGKWLRRLWLDELPQLVNVLRGDMDLVGPRPHPVSNATLFTQNVPYYALRMAVRPGLTGWAQVHSGYANDLQEETEKMRYDLYYIKHRSVWLDLRILCGTVKVVLGARDHDAAEGGAIDARQGGPVLTTPSRAAVTVDPTGLAVGEGTGGRLSHQLAVQSEAVIAAREPGNAPSLVFFEGPSDVRSAGLTGQS